MAISLLARRHVSAFSRLIGLRSCPHSSFIEELDVHRLNLFRIFQSLDCTSRIVHPNFAASAQPRGGISAINDRRDTQFPGNDGGVREGSANVGYDTGNSWQYQRPTM